MMNINACIIKEKVYHKKTYNHIRLLVLVVECGDLAQEEILSELFLQKR